MRRRCHHDLQGQQDPREEEDGTPPGDLFLFLFSLFPSLGLWYPILSPWVYKREGRAPFREIDRPIDRAVEASSN